MADPKPIAVTYIAPEDYAGPAPQPFAIVGEEPGGGGAVASVNGQTGTVVLDADAVGALPDDYTPPAPTWASVTGKPTTFAPIIGTSGTTAKAGDYTPAWGDVTGKPTTFAPATHAATLVNVAADATNGIAAGNLQVVLSALAARIVELETAP